LFFHVSIKEAGQSLGFQGPDMQGIVEQDLSSSLSIHTSSEVILLFKGCKGFFPQW